ncbi:MAG: MerR family transcriptional regulator [Spirochaetales bacterium]|nr:MerR family transcriptional regulator [Spirochaetales bacterium]
MKDTKVTVCKDTGNYRIGEVADLAGVTIRTVRYYEELGLLKPQMRKESGHRRYTHRDVVALRRIKELQDFGLSLKDIRDIAKLTQKDPTGDKRRLILLDRYQDKLNETTAKMENLQKYIQELRWHIEQLKEVKNFQSCPGKECETCKFRGICSFAENSIP